MLRILDATRSAPAHERHRFVPPRWASLTALRATCEALREGPCIGSMRRSDRRAFRTMRRCERRSQSAPLPRGRRAELSLRSISPAGHRAPAGRIPPMPARRDYQLHRGARAGSRDFDFSLLTWRASSAASARSQSLNATIFGSFATASEHTIQ